MDWLIIGSNNDPRVQDFQQALKSTGAAPARVLGYQLDWPEVLPELLTENTCLRIEAPNQLSDVRYLIRRGFDCASIDGLEVCVDESVNNADLENGEFFAPHQFYFGFKKKLEQLDDLIQKHPIAGCMNHIQDILTFFDKQHCHQALAKENIVTPEGIYDVCSYQDLREKMKLESLKNVFIKTRFGSGASGIVALKTNGTKLHSVSTVEQHNGRFYNTRRLQRSDNETEVSSLIDSLCKWGVHCESWVPKALVDKKESDCRILLVNGEADFFVLRKSNTPITNLHLMNERAKIHELVDSMVDGAWAQVLNTCKKVAALYPKSFHVAADIAVHKNLRDHSVLELNAFGDFLQKISHKGMSTHAWQLQQFKLIQDQIDSGAS